MTQLSSLLAAHAAELLDAQVLESGDAATERVAAGQCQLVWFCVGALEGDALEDMRQIANAATVPVICVSSGHAGEPGPSREDAVRAGAAEHVRLEDLSAALIDALVFNVLERAKLAQALLRQEARYATVQEHLDRQRQFDPVTRLPRREAMMERIAASVERARDQAELPFAVLFIDVDRFSALNDSVGIERGDEILAMLARRLEGVVGHGNVARFSGDKFLVLIEEVDDPGHPERIADSIYESVREPFEVAGQPVYTTVTIGMTTSKRRYDRPDDVIRDVSAAATRAKDQGSTRPEMFKTSLRTEAVEALRLEVALRQAVEREEFQVHYQPIVDLPTGQLKGFEALVRWRHPRRGVVLPSEFIPVAETTGLIVPIGRFVLREAARQLVDWIDEFECDTLTVNVNLSARQLQYPDLLDVVQEALTETGLPPGALKLELTESLVMENAESVVRVLEALRQRGVGIYVDDFGTGYSSLSYLRYFPVDGLKIDKSFVDALDGTEQSHAMVRTIVDLAQNLGIDVVAEGVEEEGQAALLRALGCATAQGYLFARPLSPGDAYAFLARELV